MKIRIVIVNDRMQTRVRYELATGAGRGCYPEFPPKAEDIRQTGRWKAIRRHVRQVEINCEPGDLFCRRRRRPTLLHWAYDSRKL